jgi:hypothetical protein
MAGAALVSAAGIALVPARAAAQMDFEVVNGTANAGAAYVVYFTGVFSNFSPGAVGSMFPLTHSHLDNAPFSQATASPADWGPAGGTVVGAYNTTPPPPPFPSTISQPQYADSRYPPGSSKPATFGNPPGPYATAISGHDGASARAGGVDTAAAQPASAATRSRRSAFDTAMTQWRARFMSPSAAAQHPAAASDPAAPDGTNGDVASSSVSLDPTKGVVATGDARLARASFGGGALVLHNVHTAVTIVNSGTPTADIVTTVGDAAVGGVPVSIGKDGVTVGAPIVPVDAAQAASAQLNGILANAGIKVSAIAPQVVTSASQQTVTATAVSVFIDQPGPPENKVIYNLGNTYVDNLAMAAPAAASPLPPLGDVSNAATLTPPQTTDVSSTTTSPPASPLEAGTPPAPAAAPAPPAKQQTKPLLPAAPAAARADKPTMLLVAYLLWQMLILATLATLWWWRNSVRRLPSVGPLS